MKIGLVTPYVYPLPGGVNEHVRYLYEGLRERGHDVRNGLSQLAEKYRVPLVLAYYNEMSYDEIAAALGLGRNHVATLIFRGKQQLRQKLQKSGKEKRSGLSE